jgi:hypothetical protein
MAMTIYQDSRPIYGPYGSVPSVCDLTALDEIALYGDLLSAVADSDGGSERLSWAVIDRALGLSNTEPLDQG